MICLSLSSGSNAGLTALLRRAASEPADVNELRLDMLREPPDIEALLQASSRPAAVVCRSRWTGGGFDGTAEARRDILRRAAAAGARYIEAEPADIAALAPHMNGAVLVSGMYDAQKTPENLGALLSEMAQSPADWVKFAVTVRRPADCIRILEAIASAPKPCIGIGMGESGLLTRILGPALGSRMTYGCLESGQEACPAQPTVRELAEMYRVKDVDESTAVYGLLGNPVTFYRGYRIFNRGFSELDLNAVYIPFPAEDAAEFLGCIPKGTLLRGLSVITPHKPAALKWASSASEAAQRIGAANTLTFRDGEWRADNTDCLAVFEAMKGLANAAQTNLTGAQALVLGSGTSARAVGVALTLLGCRVTVAGRRAENVQRLACEMDWEIYGLSEVGHGDWTVVANTTPVGMYPDTDATLFPARYWKKDMFAFDAVREPRVTRFLREARAAGARILELDELLFQIIAGQFRMWTGLELPDAAWIDDYRRGAASSSSRRIYGRQT